MFAGWCVMAAASEMLTAFVALGFVDPMILGFSFLIACGGALSDPSWQASVGDIVNRPDIPAAVPCCSSASTLSGPWGPHSGASWLLPLALLRLSR